LDKGRASKMEIDALIRTWDPKEVDAVLQDLSALGPDVVTYVPPAFPLPARPALRIPGDLTLFNAGRVQARLRSQESPWPELFGELLLAAEN
jgi:hypothetical protein